MALALQQVQKQVQKLVMTPQMQQSIQLLQLTTMQLEQLAEHEMMENPLLELANDEEELSAENSAAAGDLADSSPAESELGKQAAAEAEASPSGGLLESPDAPPPADSDAFSYDASIEPPETPPSAEPATFDSVDMDWDEYYGDSENAAYQPREDEEERDFTQYTANRVGLYEHLKRQLHLSSLEGEGFKTGEFLIGNLNDDGLFDCTPKGLLALMGAPAEALDPGAERDELQRAAADLLRKKAEELEHLDEDRLYEILMAELLGVQPHQIEGQGHEELLDRLLARMLGMDVKTLEETPPHERFLLAAAKRLGVSRDAVEDALDVVQEFEPAGIGARDLPECLRLQAEALEIRSRIFYEAVDNHLRLLQHKKFRELAQALNCSEAEAQKIFQQVSRLEPRPGRSFTKDSPRYITPDVYVKKVDGSYLYYLNEGDTGHLRISSKYRQMMQNAQSNGKDKDYVQEKFRAAAWLLRNIEKRKTTILRVTEAIMNHQKEFLEKGVEKLKPLKLREIADAVGMHESTIARVTSGKYVETPRGVFELKFFFSSSLETEDGDGASSRSIKEMIAKFVGDENPKRPLSDQKLTDMIQRQGVVIARRTVAKYREQLKILPAKLRRQSG